MRPWRLLEIEGVWLLPCQRLGSPPLSISPLQQMRHNGSTQPNLQQRRRTYGADNTPCNCSIMSVLNCKLDWFSFTFPLSQTGETDNEYLLSHVLFSFHDFTAHRYLGVVTDGLWQWEAPSGFYPFTITCPKTGIRISFGGNSGFALVSLSGQ